MKLRHGLVVIGATALVFVGVAVPTYAEAPVETVEPVESVEPVDATPTPAEPAPDDSSPAPVSETEVVQEITVESVQIAVADTGGNVSTVQSGDADPPGSEAPATDVATGSAAAAGSIDTTAIGQRVVTDLDDQARAEIIQVSIVFNIGAGVANSGDNHVASTTGGRGGGSIATGSATAVGNDSETYVTQGASGQAAAGESDVTSQRTATLQIGLSTANTGRNAIVATISGGASTAATGDAAAIGNVSSTSIDQIVLAIGRGTAVLRISQWATIVNLGIAFADTGFNQIGTSLAAAVSAGGGDALEQLLMAILPALVSSTGDDAAASGGGGAVSTGDATAIGNRSNTQVLQVAVAESDSGSVDIRQDVVVVNAGAASATTGGNAIGSGTSPFAGSPAAQAAVSQLSTFLRTFLSEIAVWASDPQAVIGSSVMQTVLGDFDIGMSSSIVASEPDAIGTSVTTRQLAAVINLAVARANSGNNSAVTTIDAVGSSALTAEPVARALDAVALFVQALPSTLRVSIVTGDASAGNASTLVLCSRSNMPDLVCLGPPEDPETPPDPGDDGAGALPVTPTPTPGPAVVELVPQQVGGTRELPATGADSAVLLLAALASLLVGSGLLVIARRPS